MALSLILMLTAASLFMVSSEMSCLFNLVIMVSLMSSASATETSMIMGDSYFMDYFSFNLIFLTLIIFNFLTVMNLFLNFSKLKHKTLLLSALQLILTMVFLTSKILLFYVMFELSLIPIFIIIAGWGYQFERLSAGAALLMYTITASLPLFLIILIIINNINSVFFHTINFNSMFSNNLPTLVVGMLITGFLVKFPIYMGHLWLPKAHVEAPASGSMILAAILLKLGGYGVARVSVLLNSSSFMWGVMILSLWGGVLSSLVCIQNLDLKIIIAYSSVAHMAIVISAMMSLTLMSMKSSMVLMFAHGFSSSGLFYSVGVMSKYSNSRSIMINKGLLITSPMFTLIWFLVLLVSMGIPPSLNFFGEVSCMINICSEFFLNSLMVVMLVFLAGCYSLIMYSIPSHGKSLLNQTAKSDFLVSEKFLGLIHCVWPFIMIILLAVME